MELREKTLELRQRIFGSDHPETLSAMKNLANSYSQLGRHHEAVELGKNVIDERKRILGSEHPRTFEARKAFEYYNWKLNEVWILPSVLAIVY